MDRVVNLRGKLVEFRIGTVYHPDAATVHEIWCKNFKLQGICEEVMEGGPDGGAYLLVRVEGSKEPVIVALEHIENAIAEE